MRKKRPRKAGLRLKEKNNKSMSVASGPLALAGAVGTGLGEDARDLIQGRFLAPEVRASRLLYGLPLIQQRLTCSVRHSF